METSGVSAPSFTSSQMHDQRSQETYAAPSSSKRRKSASDVWNHFDKRIDDGNKKAVCKYCNRDFDGSSEKGTTHLKNHSKSCPKKKSCSSLKDGETHKKMMSTRLETAGVGGDFVFDDERRHLNVARKIIKHGYPLDMVEHLFQIFVENSQPSFKLWPQEYALKDGILRVYEEEKKKLYEYLDDMILRKKILAFKKADQYDDIAGGTLFGTVTSLLQEWNIDKKLCSITLSSHPNDKMVPKLGIWLHNRACQPPLRKNFFYIHCTTDILNLLFQNGWKEVDGILGKIRNAARYTDEEQLHLELNFDQILEQPHFQGKCYSVSLTWYSALCMLEKALNLKNLISLLKTKDHDLVVPSMDEWDAAIVVYEFLKLLYDDSWHFSRCECLTANMYFSCICGIHFKLLQLEKNEHQNIRIMATKMKIPFDKYFEKCRTVLAIASILDPRQKREYVTHAFMKCYGMEVQTYLAPITSALNDIFDYYEKEFGKQALSSFVATNNGNSFTSYHDVSHYDELNWSWREEKCCGNKVASREELDRYLAEPCIDVNDEFDILDWWRSNSKKFSTLRKMALDILGIPMSTNSNFGIGDMTKIIDSTFNGLRSDIIEALICGKDWLDMSTNKASIKENEHSSSYTLNREPRDHDYTSMTMGGRSLSTGEPDQGRPDSSHTDMGLALGIGHQNDKNPHFTLITPHSPSGNCLRSDTKDLTFRKDWLYMSMNKTHTEENEHSSNYTLYRKPTDHDYTSMSTGGPSVNTEEPDQGVCMQRPDSSHTDMVLALGIGQQNGTHPHSTPITSRSSGIQVPVSQETAPNLGSESGLQQAPWPWTLPSESWDPSLWNNEE